MMKITKNPAPGLRARAEALAEDAEALPVALLAATDARGLGTYRKELATAEKAAADLLKRVRVLVRAASKATKLEPAETLETEDPHHEDE